LGIGINLNRKLGIENVTMKTWIKEGTTNKISLRIIVTEISKISELLIKSQDALIKSQDARKNPSIKIFSLLSKSSVPFSDSKMF